MYLISDINECALNISGCTQFCINTIGSFFCSVCNIGFQLDEENQTCIGKVKLQSGIRALNFYLDIDECALSISGCSHNCTNSNGSYFCTCYPGFEILNDNRTCIGKNCASNSWIRCYLQCLMHCFVICLKILTSVH